VSPSPQATATNLDTAASSRLDLHDQVPAGRETPAAVPLSTATPLSKNSPSSAVPRAQTAKARDWRLHKHADYQRVYQASRKQFASLLTYFVAPQAPEAIGLDHAAPRVGITAGKVLGKAVERNRIKRRMRAAITTNLDALRANVDVVLHPKRSVLTADWTALRNEVRRIFVKIEQGHARSAPSPTTPSPTLPEQKSRERRLPEPECREQQLPESESREQRLPESES
jgi:ribonuclease P protein component